jgi:basic membrane lipoprotein Med (substrate-binding protein (PBP1-ABC) superfamily)
MLDAPGVIRMMLVVRMTTSSPATPLRPSRRAPGARRATAPLVAAFAAAAAGVAALWLIALPVSSGTAPATPRLALVVDAGPRPDLALARARAAGAATERSGAAGVTVRVPRTAAEAAADVRYLAARRDVAEVVVVGPAASAAARAAAPDYPRARFVVRPAVPVTLG